MHVAASLFHDIAPAAQLGLTAVWINRLGEQSDLPRAAELTDLSELPTTLERLVPLFLKKQIQPADERKPNLDRPTIHSLLAWPYAAFRLGQPARDERGVQKPAPTVRERRYMELTRQFAQRRLTLLGLAGVLVLGSFFALPQGQAFASALLLFFRGQSVQAVPTNLAQLKNAYAALEDLDQLGSMQGKLPDQLNTVGSIGAAQSMAGFTLAQPAPSRLASAIRRRRSRRWPQLRSR